MTPAEVQQTLAQAMTDQQAGRLQQAALGYQAVLAVDAQHPAARSLLAIVTQAAGRPTATKTGEPRARGGPLPAQADPEALLAQAEAIVNLIRREDDETFRTLDRDRTSIPAMNAIGRNLPRHRKLLDEAVAAIEQALTIRPDWPPAHFLRGECFAINGDDRAAADAFARAAAGGHAEGRFRRAMLGGEAVDTAPAALVTRLFDDYASQFDQEMHDLACELPAILAESLAAAAGSDARFGLTVDLGCGTGRCGPFVRGQAERLVGIDLSPRMLDEAHRLGIYDELIEGDLVAGLARCSGCDLVLAADVFIYVGRLDGVFAAAAQAVKPGGWLVFSTESLAASDFRLLPTGRFAHSETYIRRMAAEHGFETELVRNIQVRLDLARRPIPGQSFALRKARGLP